ncbi:MAG: 5-methyltetrahydropteroyltriglutamate--homocysteine methyltransferase [Acidimicrobiales bacterium]
MRQSNDRILTTHAGSLPRPPDLVELFSAVSRQQIVDEAELSALVEGAVAEAVSRQHDVGIDVANDGEQGRESFFTYVQHRMTGFGVGDGAARTWKDMADFPEFVASRRAAMPSPKEPGQRRVNLTRPPQAIGAVAYGSTDAVMADCERLDRLAAGKSFVETFLTAPSPGIVVAGMANRFYETIGDYLDAVGAALAIEYRHIVEAGYVLQLDAPDLAMEHHGLFAERPRSEFLDFVEKVIATINEAVAGLPADRIRLHVCWGNYDGPHTHDVPLGDLLPLLYEADVGGLLVSGANPRHEHEYREFERHPLPNGWLLATGVIDTTTNYVEHPEVVADRIERVANAVGDPTRVLASTDCGFDTSAGFRAVAADVAWAKMASMREGADLASQRLF